MHVPQSDLVHGLGNRRPAIGWLRFKTNGTSNPVITGASSTLEGPLAPYVSSIVYSATGIETLIWTPEFKAVTNPKSGGNNPIKFLLKYLPDALANNLGIAQIGLFNNTTRTLVMQTLLATNLTTGAAPNAASYIEIDVFHSEMAN